MGIIIVTPYWAVGKDWKTAILKGLGTGLAPIKHSMNGSKTPTTILTCSSGLSSLRSSSSMLTSGQSPHILADSLLPPVCSLCIPFISEPTSKPLLPVLLLLPRIPACIWSSDSSISLSYTSSLTPQEHNCPFCGCFTGLVCMGWTKQAIMGWWVCGLIGIT